LNEAGEVSNFQTGQRVGACGSSLMWCASSVRVAHKQRTVHGLCMIKGGWLGCSNHVHVRAMTMVTDGRNTEKDTSRDHVHCTRERKKIMA
jgi:hypothetical protein